MIRLAFAIWLVFAGPIFAAPIVVKSGEHEGFTRLVLDYGAPINWSMGRTQDGYVLQLVGGTIAYDLTQVFKIIGKSRLAAIWAAPESGALNIGIACACHAIPFEFRPGILVIDLRDGPPPKGSSFELALDGTTSSGLVEKPTPRPRHRPKSDAGTYDWIANAVSTLQDRSGAAPKSASGIMPSTDPSMQPLRDDLLRQLSRGAAQGVVNIALPKQREIAEGASDNTPSVRIGLGELPGLSMGTGLPDHSDLGADGERCVADVALDIAAWGNETPISEQISAAMSGLVGEFDQVDPAAVERAVRFQLYLGFGAEAMQLLRVFPVDLPDEKLWKSLAAIMDETPDENSAFRGQTACETPAALWSVLSDPGPTNGSIVNHEAVIRAFSALPIALRRHLGPRLADRFLTLNDMETASAIRNAILRAPGKSGSEIAILEAEIDMKNGDPAAAEMRMDKVLTDPGSAGPEALVALVHARVAQDLPVDPDLVVALEAHLTERLGSRLEPQVRKALILAQAASGNFDAAFQSLPHSADVEADVWRLLAKIGVDNALLAHAVMPMDQPLPKVTKVTAQLLGERLLEFGLAAAARPWIDVSDDSLLKAKVRLALFDAAGALTSLEDSVVPESMDLRAEAQRILSSATAPQAYAEADDVEGQRAALAKAQNWPELAAMNIGGWTSAIVTLEDFSADPSVGPLASGHLLADHSAKTQAAVSELLGNIALPKLSSP